MRDAISNRGEGAEGPVTVIVTWKILPGREKEFEGWRSGIVDTAHAFPGHLGSSVIRPARPGDDHVVILRFDNYAHLKAWQDSAERREWLERARPLAAAAPTYRTESGIEFWFRSPTGGTPPPRWKMAAIGFATLYPLIKLLNVILAPVLKPFPTWLAGLLTVMATILLMTWVIMPAMTRLFSRWLYPRREGEEQS